MGDARRDADVAALTRSLAGETVGTYAPESRRPYTTHEVTRTRLPAGFWVGGYCVPCGARLRPVAGLLRGVRLGMVGGLEIDALRVARGRRGHAFVHEGGRCILWQKRRAERERPAGLARDSVSRRNLRADEVHFGFVGGTVTNPTCGRMHNGDRLG